MERKIILIDDTEQMLLVKKEILQTVGFEVTAYQHARHAIFDLARQPEPFALITDTDMPYINGPDLLLYLSPKIDREDEGIKRAMKRVYAQAKPDYVNIFRRLEGQFTGKLILTSRQELKPIPIDDDLQEDTRLEIVAANEALRIADGIFKIDKDGSGMGSLIDYLSK